MKNRMVELVLHSDFSLHDIGIQTAIGYLSTWAMGADRYKNVSIYGDDEGNLTAIYKNGAGEVTYEIGAIRADDGTYSFHS